GAGQSVSGPVSGPVGFSSASVGEFGPAPVMAAPVMPAPAMPAPRDAGRTAAGGERPGKVSLSLAAAATAGEGGRGRRLSCTVALAVAGALAAVTVGSVFVLDLMPGSGSDDNDSAAGSDASSSAPAATAPPAATGVVPAVYVGTWEGQGSGLGGRLPMGTFRLTVKQAAVGKELGRLRQTDVLGGVCLDVLTLTKVTSKELITTSVGAATNHGGCNPAAHTVRLTRTGDDLTYRSESSAEGNPVARMSRID
ncbi:serine/threonine protein kinase, partial [Streptomyces sp. ID05-39B]|nr:serine/threonine protein kinase [Streptomyces sp. ID05-39B]